MKVLIDTANLETIARINGKIGIAGVTTNPSILAQEGKNPMAILKLIKNIIGSKMLHVQVNEATAEGMVKNGKNIVSQLGEDVYIKIPVTLDGLAAMRELKKFGYKITATAIFTPLQALLAANEGADFVAPYVNRIDNLSGRGINVVEDIALLFRTHDIKTQILGASFKNTQQVLECGLAGMHACTIQEEILLNMINHPLTDLALEKFENDWDELMEKLGD